MSLGWTGPDSTGRGVRTGSEKLLNYGQHDGGARQVFPSGRFRLGEGPSVRDISEQGWLDFDWPLAAVLNGLLHVHIGIMTSLIGGGRHWRKVHTLFVL